VVSELWSVRFLGLLVPIDGVPSSTAASTDPYGITFRVRYMHTVHESGIRAH